MREQTYNLLLTCCSNYKTLQYVNVSICFLILSIYLSMYISLRPPGSLKTLISRGSQAAKNKLSPLLTMYGNFPECVPICVLIVHLQYASSVRFDVYWTQTNKKLKISNMIEQHSNCAM